MHIEKNIIDNVNSKKIDDFIIKQKLPIEKKDMGREKQLLLQDLLNERLITEEAINEFLYKELMFGHRRLVRIYELKTARKIRREGAWSKFFEKYKCDSLKFNRIISTNLHGNEKIKVAAIKSETEYGILQRVEILFVFNMLKGIRKNSNVEYVYSYLPVVFDFEKRILMIKVWNRELGIEENTPNEQLNFVFEKLKMQLEFDIKPISNNPQRILYLMSKDLFENFFNQLPNIGDIEAKRNCLDDIVNILLTDINLKNSERNGQKVTMNPEIINVQEEIYKLLQQVALFDYLKDKKINTLLNTTEDKYISRIRFNDKDNLSASLTGEKGVKCIYDTKTFMCIRNSLELVARVVSIVVTFVNEKKHITAKYEAIDSNFLNIHILNNRYYTEEEFENIWELYKKYEKRFIAENGTLYTEDNAEAM